MLKKVTLGSGRLTVSRKRLFSQRIQRSHYASPRTKPRKKEEEENALTGENGSPELCFLAVPTFRFRWYCTTIPARSQSNAGYFEVVSTKHCAIGSGTKNINNLHQEAIPGLARQFSQLVRSRLPSRSTPHCEHSPSPTGGGIPEQHPTPCPCAVPPEGGHSHCNSHS